MERRRRPGGGRRIQGAMGGGDVGRLRVDHRASELVEELPERGVLGVDGRLLLERRGASGVGRRDLGDVPADRGGVEHLSRFERVELRGRPTPGDPRGVAVVHHHLSLLIHSMGVRPWRAGPVGSRAKVSMPAYGRVRADCGRNGGRRRMVKGPVCGPGIGRSRPMDIHGPRVDRGVGPRGFPEANHLAAWPFNSASNESVSQPCGTASGHSRPPGTGRSGRSRSRPARGSRAG